RHARSGDLRRRQLHRSQSLAAAHPRRPASRVAVGVRGRTMRTKTMLFSAMALLAALSASAQPDGRVLWQDDAVELYRGPVSDRGERTQVELCVRPKREKAAISVGYPRYHMTWGRTGDPVVVGIERSRLLRAPACFSVLVPWGAATIELPIGDTTLDIEIGSDPFSKKVPDPFSS